jgi:hypothetical protein
VTTSEPPRPAREIPGREEIPYVDDPWTKVFVVVVAVFFLAVFANAFLLGEGGFLTRTPSPSPIPSPTASASATASGSASVSASASPSAGATASPTP